MPLFELFTFFLDLGPAHPTFRFFFMENLTYFGYQPKIYFSNKFLEVCWALQEAYFYIIFLSIKVVT